MVLYKRKQVTFIRPQPLPEDLSTEVFMIPETREWFINYTDYLERMDYYKGRKFVCEITGNSCLTFFEALESEIKEIKWVERDFPESLREHILRFLQFNRITRLDQLVDKVYLVFKNDYFPGETIFIKGSISSSTVGQTKQKGTIREKVQYNNPEDGSSSTKYLVVRLNDMKQAMITQDKISRDRNHFTKWLIKTFIKLTMTRSHKVGAPWVVKDKYARKYRIPQDYPEDLKHFEVFTPSGESGYQEEKKKRGRRPASANTATTDGTDPIETGDNVDGEKEKTKTKKRGRKKKNAPGEDEEEETTALTSKKEPVKGKKRGPKKKDQTEVAVAVKNETPVVEIPKKKLFSFPNHYLPDALIKEHEQKVATTSGDKSTDAPSSQVVPLSALQPTQKTITDDLQLRFDLQRARPVPLKYVPLTVEVDNVNSQVITEEDDYFDEEEINGQKAAGQFKNSPFPIQKALECWAFLNIYHKVLKLDTFTFDDFMFAIGWNSEHMEEVGNCELLDEIFCAVLGAIMSNETGKKTTVASIADPESITGLLITLPPKSVFYGKPNDSSEHDGDDDEDRGSDTENEDQLLKLDKQSDGESDSEEKENKSHKNGSSSSQVIDTDGNEADDEDGDEDEENAEEDDEEHEDDDGEEFFDHNAYSVMNYRNTTWVDRLRRRNFKDGNWQCIMMGVFSMVEYVKEFKPLIDFVYKTLAPLDDSRSNNNATPTMVATNFYENLTTPIRIHCLNILISLLSTGKIVRGYIDDCLEASTGLRRDRLDNIRDYKACLEGIHQLHNQVQIKLEEARKEKKEKEELEKKDEAASEEKDLTDSKQEKNDEDAMEVDAVGSEAIASLKDKAPKPSKGRPKKTSNEIDEKNEDITMKDENSAIKEVKSEAGVEAESNTNDDESKKANNVKTTEVKEEPKRRTMVRINFQDFEMSEEEKELSLIDKDFKQIWEKKRDELLRIADIKKAKKSIELKLVEIDCQRVKLLGKDRFGNKYWWFENNGLPTLHSGSNGEDNEDDEDSKDKDPKDKDEDDDLRDEVLDETYLMGRLWVQGPSKDDILGILNSNDEEVQSIKLQFKNSFKSKRTKKSMDEYYKTQEDIDGYYEDVEKHEEYKEMDFTSYPPFFTKTMDELYGIQYFKKQIIDTKHTGIPKEESTSEPELKYPKLESKANTAQDNGAEPRPDPEEPELPHEKSKHLLINRFGEVSKTENWKYLTAMERKLIEEGSNSLLSSSEWRFYERLKDIEKLLAWMNPWGTRESQLRKELLVVKDALVHSIDARRKALWFDKLPDNEIEIGKQLEDIEAKLNPVKAKKNAKGKKEDGNKNDDEDELLEEQFDSDDLDRVVIIPRGKRRAAAVAAQETMSTKRQKVSSPAAVPAPLTPKEIIARGSVEELKELKGKLEESLEEAKKERELSRMIEWVNFGARDEFDKSLYEGGDKSKPKPRK